MVKKHLGNSPGLASAAVILKNMKPFGPNAAELDNAPPSVKSAAAAVVKAAKAATPKGKNVKKMVAALEPPASVAPPTAMPGASPAIKVPAMKKAKSTKSLEEKEAKKMAKDVAKAEVKEAKAMKKMKNVLLKHEEQVNKQHKKAKGKHHAAAAKSEAKFIKEAMAHAKHEDKEMSKADAMAEHAVHGVSVEQMNEHIKEFRAHRRKDVNAEVKEIRALAAAARRYIKQGKDKYGILPELKLVLGTADVQL